MPGRRHLRLFATGHRVRQQEYLARGKGLGSVKLDTMECTIYVHREYPNEFAVK